MPRKEWVPKNQYCKRSRMDSSEFGTLVHYYFREVLFNEPRDSCYYDYIVTCHFNDNFKFTPDKNYNDSLRFKYISTSFINLTDKEIVKPLRDKLAFKKKPISKESFNNYFNRMGLYIWEKSIIDLHPAFREENVFGDLIDLIYGKIDKITSYPELYYDFLSGFPLYINEDNIIRSMMFYLLSNRSKVTKGFNKDTFNLEFSRVFFICEVIGKFKIKIRSIYSTEEVDKLDEIVFAAMMFFMSKLLETPM